MVGSTGAAIDISGGLGGYDHLILDPLTSVGAILLGDHQLKVNDTSIVFKDGLDRISMRDLNVVRSLVVTSTAQNWGGTDFELSSSGIIDVKNASFKMSDGHLTLIAPKGVDGVLNTQIDGLTVVNNASGALGTLVVREADSLRITSDGQTNGGLYAVNGKIDVQLNARESLLRLDSGVIVANADGITLVADDMDFLSGDNQVRSSGLLTIQAKSLDQSYRIGGSGQSIYGNDYSQAGSTGFMELGMRDISALRDGFSAIHIGHRSNNAVLMYVGDLRDAAVFGKAFSARLTDATALQADHILVQGNVQSTDTLSFNASLMEVNKQNINDPLGVPDSGVQARDLQVVLSEQMLVSGFLIGNDAISLTVSGSTGATSLVKYPGEVNSFTADAGASISVLNAGAHLTLSTSGSVVSGTGMFADAADALITVNAGTGLTLLQGATVSAGGDRGKISLSGQSYLRVLAQSAVMSGGRYDYAGTTPVPVKTGADATLSLSTKGEMLLAGSLLAASTLSLSSGNSIASYADYFDTLPGNTLTQVSGTAVSATMTALKTGTLSSELQAAIAAAHLDMGSSYVVQSMDNYTPFSDLSDAAKLELASTLGYTVYKDGGFYNASTHTFVTTLTGGNAALNSGYTYYSSSVYYKADAPAAKQLLTGFSQGVAPDYNNAQINWAAAGVSAPGNPNADFASLSAAQKMVVANSLGYVFDYYSTPGNLWNANTPDDLSDDIEKPDVNAKWTDLTAQQKAIVANFIDNVSTVTVKTASGDVQVAAIKNYFNYNAVPGKKAVTSFTQGAATDYSNADIYWGAVTPPASNAAFSSLSDAQKAIVAHALGYEVSSGPTYYNPNAAAGLKLVQSFGTGSAPQFDINAIDWGGPAKPAAGATFEDLGVVQRAVVVRQLGYTQIEQQVFYGPGAAAGQQIRTGFEVGVDFKIKDITWGTVTQPSDGTDFAKMSGQQQDLVLAKLGYQRWSGVVYFKADAEPAKQYALSFKAGTDYKIDDIHWSAVDIPAAGTLFKDMTDAQKYQILNQTGYKAYKDQVFFKNGAGDNSLKQTFVQGVDYTNAAVSASVSAAQNTRWLLHALDASGQVVNTYEIYASDPLGNGVIAEVQVQTPHALVGQRGFGFMLTGTVTTLQANADLVVSGAGDAIIRGNINLLGAGSDLTVQSDRWVYWEGAAKVAGNITLEGGWSLDGTQNLHGANADGVSVYLHATAALNTLSAGSSITLRGGQDVLLYGTVLAGGQAGASGVVWRGPDSTILVTAGEQVLVDGAMAAAKSITIRTDGAPGANDGGYSLVETRAGGLMVGGLTSDGSGGMIDVQVAGGITFSGLMLAGGTVRQTYNAGVLQAETVLWSSEDSTVHLQAGGQLYVGAMERTTTGELVEVGATVRANHRIELIGGISADGVGVRLPGGARIATSNDNGEIYVSSQQDALIYGQLVAGGEIVDHYDALGKFLGSTVSTYDGDSSIVIEALRQVRLGRDLFAGKTLDVRGGTSTRTNTAADPWANNGIVVGGNVHLKTTRDNSTLTLSAAGDLSILAPAWSQELAADGFAERSSGVLSKDVSFSVTLDLGTHIVQGLVTLLASDTANNTGNGDLMADVQAAISKANLFTVTTSLTGSPAVGSQQTVASNQLAVNLKDGRLMLTGNYAFTLAAVAGGNAELIGLSQLAAGSGQTFGPSASARGYAIDAEGRGAVVNIGKANSAQPHRRSRAAGHPDCTRPKRRCHHQRPRHAGAARPYHRPAQHHRQRRDADHRA
ncbi:MAG: hypothetical protein NTZ64_16245 [Polaromonas sp.]|nr:hypothetical protein [Polaromonas sp.]